MPADNPRARSFGSVAANYHRYRPRTPDTLLDWLVPPAARDVIDLAAGTGALTELLAQRVPSVTAVEPDPGMRTLLAATVPSAHILDGTAEAIPVADESADAIFVASAWHWFDPEHAVPEIARVLRDHGRLCVLRNGLDGRVEWTAALRHRVSSDSRERPRHQVLLPAGSPFEEAETRDISWVSAMTVDDVLNLLETYSQLIVASPQERQQARERAETILAEHPETRGREVLDVPMRSWAWRSVRRPRAR